MDNRIKADWDEIIKRERMTATYKFALAKALIYLGDGRNRLVDFDKLAYFYSREFCNHLKRYERQSTFKTSRFIRACKDYNDGIISDADLKKITVDHGLSSILDTFHNIDEGTTKTKFYKYDFNRKNILLSSELINMVMVHGRNSLIDEIEARWSEVERGWNKN